MKKIGQAKKIGIVGATGYTGLELLKLLNQHPCAVIHYISSRKETGRNASDIFPELRGRVDLEFQAISTQSLAQCDLVFFATPHGVAMQLAPDLIRQNVKVIDLSADFRLKDASQWEHWYQMPHEAKNLLEQAVYGLPEINRSKLKEALLIANPGCYPTAVSLGLLPLLEENLIAPGTVIVDAKSGVSGAGRTLKPDLLACEVFENFKAYGASGHRHLPEIRQVLQSEALKLIFVPHLLPMIRGMEATIYISLKDPTMDIHKLYQKRYQQEVFIDVLPEHVMPETKSVSGQNICRIGMTRPQGSEMIVISSVIDNLVKGAAGQAIQNMNIAFGWPETTGLL